MEYVIYTVGNAEFLRAIFNGVTMITTSDSFPTLISIGLMFGILYVCWESVFNATRTFNIQHMLVAVLMYLVMFRPTRTVVIQDVYNVGGSDITVDNVPLGVATSGSIVSRIGYKLCVLIEQAYQPANAVATVHEGGFAEPLRILNQFRNFDFGPKLFETMNVKQGVYVPSGETGAVESDFKTAIANYIDKCTYTEIAMGHTSPDKIKTAAASTNPLKSPSGMYHVYLPLNIDSGNHDKQVFSCTAGYDALVSAINERLGDPEVKQVIARGIGGSATRSVAGDDEGATGGADATVQITGALNALGKNVDDVQALVRTRIIESALQRAATGYYKSQQDTLTGVAVTSAIEQRNVQWASEGTMFTKSVHALMTFIEGFCYAIMPIMAFVFVMGAMGMRIVGKYFQIILWIQLWYPIMAIVNLYIINSTRTALAPYPTSWSFYDTNAMFHEVQTHIGVAGMMLGATPLLALLIITGSSMAFTAIAGRMGGQDHFNEKLSQPDAITPAPVLQQRPMAGYDRYQSALMSGGESLTPSLDHSAFQQRSVQLAQAQATEAMSAASTNLSVAFNNDATRSLASSIARTAGSSFSASDSASVQAINNIARKLGYSTSSDGSLTAEQRGQFMADWNAGLRLGLAGGGVSGSWTDASGVTHTWKASEAIGKDEVAQFSKAHGSTINKAMTTAFNKSLNSSDSMTQSALQGTTLGKSMSESVRKSETLTMSENASSSMGTGVKTRLDTIAGNIQQQAAQGNMGTYRRLQSAYMELANGGLKGSTLENFNTRVRTLADAHGGNLLMGQQIATLEYLSKAENGRLGDFAEITNKAIGTNFVAENGFIGDHKMPEPEKVQGDFSQVGYRGDPNLRQSVQSGVQTTGGEVKQATGKPEEQYTKTGASPEKHFQNSTKETEAVNARNQGGMIHKQFKEAEKNLQNPIIPPGSTNMPTSRSSLLPDSWRAELDKATEGLPRGVAEGIKDYIVQGGMNGAKQVTQFADKNDSVTLMDPSLDTTALEFKEIKKGDILKEQSVAVNAESRMYNDVVNAYKAHYGKDFSEEKYRDGIDKTVNGIRQIAVRGYSKESVSEVASFLKQSYKP